MRHVYLQSEISIEKCVYPERSDTCFHFKTFKTSDNCKIMTSTTAPWATFVDKCMTPKFSCPLKKVLDRNCLIISLLRISSCFRAFIKELIVL